MVKIIGFVKRREDLTFQQFKDYWLNKHKRKFILKTYGDLLDRIQEYYNKSYNKVQSEDIQKYLTERNFPISALRNLYDLITQKSSFLPKIDKFKDIIDEALQSGSVSITGGLHPESPYQQLTYAKDWPPERIIEKCKKIRRKQVKLKISYIHYNICSYCRTMVLQKRHISKKINGITWKYDTYDTYI